MGIKLRDSESEFRNFGDVLDEVGAKWETLSSVQQQALAVAMSGTRMQNKFKALMENYSKALDEENAALNSSGTALEKFSVYEESVEAKTARMAAAFENFSTTLLDSGLIGGILDIGTELFNAGAAMDAWPAKIMLVTTGVITLTSALSALSKSSFGAEVLKNFKDLGWPKTTGDKWNIVPSYGKEAA